MSNVNVRIPFVDLKFQHQSIQKEMRQAIDDVLERGDFILGKALSDFEAENTVIVGVSPDTAAKHDKFKAKHDLGITLVSDPEQVAANGFGVWVEKSMYGKTYMGVERSTFLIDPEGKIAEIWRKVKVPGHVDAVLERVKSA